MSQKKHVYIYNRAKDIGIPVVDSNERTFVAVTADDVIRARKANSKHCALARAALRVDGVNAAYFFRTTAFLEFENKILRYTLPSSVQKEILSFDRAQIFAPGVYQLSPQSRGSRLDEAAKRKRAISAGKVKVKTRKVRPTERASLAAAIATFERESPTALAQLAKIQKIKPAAKSVSRPASVSTLRAAKPPHNSVSDKTSKSQEAQQRVSGIMGPKAPAPLLPNGRYYRKTQYIRDLEEP